jgi:hypothetical protein
VCECKGEWCGGHGRRTRTRCRLTATVQLRQARLRRQGPESGWYDYCAACADAIEAAPTNALERRPLQK